MDMKLYAEYETAMKPKEWSDRIPAIHFDNKWDVQIIPPFGGALVRFKVMHNGKHCSVYLDGYDNLGFVGEPYWEIYPFKDDTYRCLMNKVGELELILHCILNDISIGYDDTNDIIEWISENNIDLCNPEDRVLLKLTWG